MTPAFRVFSYTGDPVAIPADLTENVMFSATIPGGTLAEDGSALEWTIHGSANDDNGWKTVRVYLGPHPVTTDIIDMPNTNWCWRVVIVRKNATGDLIRAKLGATCYYESGGYPNNYNGIAHAGSAVPISIPGVDWTADLPFRVTGQTTLASVGAIVGFGCSVFAWP